MKGKARILLIEDDAGIVGGLKRELQAEGYIVVVTARGGHGLAEAKQQYFDAVITDLRMPGLSGLELVEQLHAAKPKLPIIMMTGFGTTETAIEATKQGAYDYLLKPLNMVELLDSVAKAVACNRLMSEPIELGTAPFAQSAIIGNSRAMQGLYKEIGRIASTAVTVLIRGETGTGKELVARAIYQHSQRAAQPFIAVSCAAIPETLLESELFGHERGAFTGAHIRRIGRFEQANRGTIFLDEIGDLSLSTQVKLLRVLQERYIQRVGGNEKVPVDVRVLTATHRDLEGAIKEKQFREDLFYRLSGVTITLPPLSQRAEDIPDLVKYFLRRFAFDSGRSPFLPAAPSLARQRARVGKRGAAGSPAGPRLLDQFGTRAAGLCPEPQTLGRGGPEHRRLFYRAVGPGPAGGTRECPCQDVRGYGAGAVQSRH